MVQALLRGSIEIWALLANPQSYKTEFLNNLKGVMADSRFLHFKKRSWGLSGKIVFSLLIF